MRFERVYNVSPQALWSAISEKKSIEQWWCETDFQARVGHRFYMQDKPMKGWAGRTEGEVLEAVPPERLVYTWQDPHDASSLKFTLKWTITPLSEKKTQIVLEHTGFKGLKGLFLGAMMFAGWRGYFNKLLPDMARHIQEHGKEATFHQPPKAVRVDYSGAGA